jgi:hypothetical protein
MGERDRQAVTPYRESGALEGEPVTAARYVPLTRREDRLRRVLRSVPVVLFAAAAFLLDRPWLIAVALAWGIGLLVLARMHARALNERLKALAGTLARDGDPSVASRALEALVGDARPYPGFHCVALLFLGIARARAGDCDGALELLYAIQRSGWLAHRVLWMAWLLPWLSQLHAARGDLDLAEQWLEVARAKLPAEKKEVLVSPECLIALRRGKNDEVVAAVDAYVAAADASDPVRQHFALLRAFALDRAGRPMPDAAVRELVRVRVASPGRALPIEKWWADFATYVDAHTPEG